MYYPIPRANSINMINSLSTTLEGNDKSRIVEKFGHISRKCKIYIHTGQNENNEFIVLS